MGRRHRHFNPVHAGANTAIDARFILNLSDGATIENLTSRAGASISFSQATAGSRPFYKTGGQGGQPYILCGAVTGQGSRWFLGSGLAIASTTSLYSGVLIVTSNTTRCYTQTSDNSFIGGNSNTFYTLAVRDAIYNITTTAFDYSVNDTSSTSTAAFGRSGSATIFSQSRTSISPTTTTTGSTADLSTTRNASSPSTFLADTRILAFCIFPISVTEDLRRRTMDSYIFSYKYS